MKLEIERRFLLKSFPRQINWLKDFEKHLFIKQFYYDRNVDEYEGSFRLRREQVLGNGWHSAVLSTSFDITRKKLINKGVFEEEIVEINNETYQRINMNMHDGSIDKMRSVVKCPDNIGLKWEIDNFKSPIKLIIAEIELPSMDYDLKIPDFLQEVIITEVTGQKEFSNRSLAIK
jgi:CYTH domain-containing protein